jgi:hypothetical protein
MGGFVRNVGRGSMTTRGRAVSETLRQIMATLPKPPIPDSFKGNLQDTFRDLAKEWEKCRDRNPETHEKAEV